ncbi:MAG: hypothetical protein MJ231_00835 [bacterium]|nr:hypothetical protein [bacterium]
MLGIILIKRIFYSLIIVTLVTSSTCAIEYRYTKDGFKYAYHYHNESSYQHAWCSEHNGVEEYVNSDYTRVDCLTDVHAVEFDFANKWAESIGQAEHYAKMTGKKGMVVLILENPEAEMIYFNRIKELAKIHSFDVEYVTPEILHIVNGKCEYADCKCHRNKAFSFIRKLFTKRYN